MRTILNGYKVDETFPLPCYTKEGVLKYDAKWADDLVCRCYGTDTSKYEINESTLELYYIVSNKMRFKVAEITYESYFTDIQGREWEEEFKDTWFDLHKGGDGRNGPEDYEMYNITLFHYDHPALKSQLLGKNGELRGINSEEYLKGIMEKIERDDFDDDDEYDGPTMEDILGGDDEDADDPYYK